MKHDIAYRGFRYPPEIISAAVAMLDGSHDLVTVDQIATEVA